MLANPNPEKTVYLNYSSLTEYKRLDHIPLPTASDAGKLYWHAQYLSRDPSTATSKLLIGYIPTDTFKIPVWAFMKKDKVQYIHHHHSAHGGEEINRDRFVLLFPFSEIGFGAKEGTVFMLDSYIAAHFTAGMGFRFPQGGGSGVSVGAYEKAAQKINSEVEKRANRDVLAGELPDVWSNQRLLEGSQTTINKDRESNIRLLFSVL